MTLLRYLDEVIAISADLQT